MAAFTGREELPEFSANLLGRMLSLARVAAVFVMSFAFLAIAGWAFNIEALRSVIPGLTAMNPGGTAFAFLLASGSLWCLAQEKHSNLMMRIASGLAACVISIALLKLSLYLLGMEWGPDQWLFRGKLDEYHPPNRMAPNTAIGLLLSGLALLLIDVQSRRGFRLAQWFAFAAALLATLTLVGYACNASLLIAIRAFIPMALNSAMTLAVLNIGILFARPQHGLMAVICSHQIGGVMARRMLPATILAPAAFAWFASSGQAAGLFDSSFGISLFVVSTIVLFAVLIWWNAQSLNRIDIDRARTQKDLVRSEAILRSVVNSMGDGVVVADRNGRFLLFNPVAERILGVGATEASPSEWADQYGIFSPETGEHMNVDEIPLVRAIHGESTNQHELLIKNPNLPDPIHISVTGRPLKGDEGVEGGVVVFQDTSQRRRDEEMIRRARDEANAANRAKSEFLANMSHEIRTPMNAVIGMTGLVLDSDLDEMQRGYLKIVQDSAESLLSLIDDILDFSKIEAGKLELDRSPFQLRELLGDTMKSFSMRARGKELELAFRVAPDVPDFLIGDPYRLRQVVTNLVGNALKFTEKGEVVLDVSLDAISDDQVSLHVQVKDTGIGIPADKLHMLFNAFSQVDASTTRRYGGTGLGLAITGRLVPLMHGTTWVESEPGQGSTFHFTAQFQQDHRPPSPSVAPETLKNLHVLVVDDNQTNRLIMQELLASWEMRPVCVASADQAFAALRAAWEAADPFRVVLSDVRMPDTDGFQLAARIRQDCQLARTPIVMLSSGAVQGDVARCNDLGIATHLIKPVKSSELLATIAAVMGDVQDRDKQDSIEIRNGRPLKILLAEDSLANQKLAMGVLRKWGHSLTLANNGMEAVEAFKREAFDIILMDVQMPEMDGLQATAAIRIEESTKGRRIPIIAMTAHAMKGDREHFIRAGMDECVTKPIRWPELRQILDHTVPTSEFATSENNSTAINPSVP